MTLTAIVAFSAFASLQAFCNVTALKLKMNYRGGAGPSLFGMDIEAEYRGPARDHYNAFLSRQAASGFKAPMSYPTWKKKQEEIKSILLYGERGVDWAYPPDHRSYDEAIDGLKLPTMVNKPRTNIWRYVAQVALFINELSFEPTSSSEQEDDDPNVIRTPRFVKGGGRWTKIQAEKHEAIKQGRTKESLRELALTNFVVGKKYRHLLTPEELERVEKEERLAEARRQTESRRPRPPTAPRPNTCRGAYHARLARTGTTTTSTEAEVLIPLKNRPNFLPLLTPTGSDTDSGNASSSSSRTTYSSSG